MSFFYVAAISYLSSPSILDPGIDEPPYSEFFEQFEPLLKSPLSKVVHHHKPSYTAFDSIHICLFKGAFSCMGPVILALINKCLSSGCIPCMEDQN